MFTKWNLGIWVVIESYFRLGIIKISWYIPFVLICFSLEIVWGQQMVQCSFVMGFTLASNYIDLWCLPYYSSLNEVFVIQIIMSIIWAFCFSQLFVSLFYLTGTFSFLLSKKPYYILIEFYNPFALISCYLLVHLALGLTEVPFYQNT